MIFAFLFRIKRIQTPSVLLFVDTAEDLSQELETEEPLDNSDIEPVDDSDIEPETISDIVADEPSDGWSMQEEDTELLEALADTVVAGEDGLKGADAPSPKAEQPETLDSAEEEESEETATDEEVVASAEEEESEETATDEEVVASAEDEESEETATDEEAVASAEDEESEATVADEEVVASGEEEESEETVADEEEREILGEDIILEPQLLSEVKSGYYTVDATGKVEFTFIFDSGAYEGQLAAISMTGMENLDLNSSEFFQESLQRALSGSEAKLGYIVIDDISAGAMFSGELEPGFDYNHGEFPGAKEVEFNAGDKFFLMLIPNGSVAEVVDALEQGITKDVRPLFSLVAANPTKAIQMGQIIDVTGDGNTYVFEDIREDGASDKDFNDLIFQVKGATITTVTLDDLILEGEMSPEADWRNTEIGQQIVDYAASQVVIAPEPNPVEKYEFPKEDQPLVGFIDTHFTQGNPDIDYSRIIFGKDYIQNDSDPTVVAVAGEGTHGDHILGIVAATQDNGLGIDGLNDDAPLWVSSAVESGKWADALVEFVDAAIASNQPNAIINLSIDLTQVNPDGSVTTRYEFTPQERAAIEYARQNGVLIVAAAGNDGGVMSVLGQASQEFDNIITVGATDGMARADYSSYGYGLDIVAPGGTTANPVISLTGENLGEMAGTSVATAKVTGAASQVWAANPELSYRQVIEILKETATDINTPGWDEETGAGLLDMAAAVGLAKVTQGQPYDVLATMIPETWSGEGKVIPLERASQTPENFRLRVWPDLGVNLRNSPNINDRSPYSIPKNTWLDFDAWTWGNVNIDPVTGGQDALYYRTWYNGRAYWVPSIWIDGYPSSCPSLLPPTQQQPQPQPSPNNGNRIINEQPQPQPSPNNGNRIINAVNKVNPDQWYYRPRDITGDRINETFCNWFAADVLDQLGVPVPRNGPSAGSYTKPHPIYGTNTPHKPYGTDQLLDFMRRGGDGMWEPVSASDAVTSANNGQVVLACSSGHVAVVIPGGSGSNVLIAQAGATNGRKMSVTEGFGNIVPTYFRYKGTVKGSVSPNTNTSYSPPATPGQTRQYVIKAGDTLSGIAQKELHNANRWTEIKKADGSTFTAAEARNLQVGQSVYLPVNYQTGTGNPSVSPPSSTPVNSDIRWVNFSGTVGPSIGVNLRNSTRFSDRSSRNEPNGKTLEFDAWTYGETGTDMWTGQPDARWFKVKGTNLWVPSAYIWGNPPNSSPMPSSSNNNSSGAIGAIGVVTIGVGETLPKFYNGRERVDDSGWMNVLAQRNKDFNTKKPNLFEQSVLGNAWLAHQALKTSWQLAGWDDAAELLGKYLDSNNGGKVSIDLDEAIRESSKMANELVENFSLTEIINAVKQGYKSGIFGKNWDTAGSFDLFPNSNWAQALGGFSKRYEGNFQENSDGSITISMKFFAKDVYDFVEPKWNLTQSHNLHLSGIARAFETTGESKTYTWKFNRLGMQLDCPQEFSSTTLKGTFTLIR